MWRLVQCIKGSGRVVKGSTESQLLYAPIHRDESPGSIPNHNVPFFSSPRNHDLHPVPPLPTTTFTPHTHTASINLTFTLTTHYQHLQLNRYEYLHTTPPCYHYLQTGSLIPPNTTHEYNSRIQLFRFQPQRCQTLRRRLSFGIPLRHVASMPDVASVNSCCGRARLLRDCKLPPCHNHRGSLKTDCSELIGPASSTVRRSCAPRPRVPRLMDGASQILV